MLLKRILTSSSGHSDHVFHEIASPDIHVDIFIVEPTAERNYYTLVTSGMGAHRMNVPKELAEYKLERAEIVVYLPADWNISDHEEKNYWPLRWLKNTCPSAIGRGLLVRLGTFCTQPGNRLQRILSFPVYY